MKDAIAAYHHEDMKLGYNFVTTSPTMFQSTRYEDRLKAADLYFGDIEDSLSPATDAVQLPFQ